MRFLNRFAWAFVPLFAGGPPILAGQAEPPQHLEGTLFQMGSLGEITGTELGTFRLDSAGAGDLRATPGTAELGLSSGGRLSESEGVVNEVRAVDASTGRPLQSGGSVCTTGAEPDCLPTSHCMPTPTGPDPMGECDVSGDVNAFRAINGMTIGFSDLDRNVGGFTVFNSLNTSVTDPADPGFATRVTIATALSNLLAGDASGLVLAALLGLPIPGGHCDPGDVITGTLCNPLISLSNDVTGGAGIDLDGPALAFGEALAAGLNPTPIDGAVLYASGLQLMLTDQQQASLGCGPFYGTFCDGHGIGILHTEAIALMQSWPTTGSDPTDPFFLQPGTVGYQGEPVCARFENEQSFILPGCRGLVDVGPDGVPDTLDEILAGTSDDTFDTIDSVVVYDPAVDGTTTSAGPGLTFPAQPRVQPFTGQFFNSEMAVLSWNAAMALAALSSPTDRTGDGVPDVTLSDFDPNDPFRTNGCSFAAPYACGNIQAFAAILTRELDDDPSGPPQRRWVWETGAEYLQTDGATGGLADFAVWTFHALGPEVSRREAPASDEAGVLFVLGPPEGLGTVPDSDLIVTGSPGPDGIVGTSDDPFVGLAYGVVPEPSQVVLQLAALLAAVGVARCSWRAAG